MIIFFFFQAEDGIRDRNVTGVQTCALPISGQGRRPSNIWTTSRKRTRPSAGSPPPRSWPTSTRSSARLGRATVWARATTWTAGGCGPSSDLPPVAGRVQRGGTTDEDDPDRRAGRRAGGGRHLRADRGPDRHLVRNRGSDGDGDGAPDLLDARVSAVARVRRRRAHGGVRLRVEASRTSRLPLVRRRERLYP